MATTGKILMIASNFAYACGAFIADWNETHVKVRSQLSIIRCDRGLINQNPNWPPHARFHNGQTMSLGLCLFAVTTYLLLRPAASKEAAKDSVWISALVGTMYTTAGLSAILYPGVSLDDNRQSIWSRG